ncbi:MAG: hypothetical protein ACFB8W_10855 [Elainellaceae cyanobacterium]
MIYQLFPYPAIDRPLSRLHTYDGLMINAKRWQLAHDYHHRRQAIHYQSINQPGIVYGLGVRKLETPPVGVPAQFRDQRWLEIQPGLAIDVAGNPIIVNERIAFRLETEAPETGAKVVHVVLSYVEPKHLNRQHHSDASDEQYRIDEKVACLSENLFSENGHREAEPLSDRDIELCRLRLESEAVRVANPVDVLRPGVNEIDLRYRCQAQARPQAVVRVAQVQSGSEAGSDRHPDLTCLLRSLPALYPPLQGFEKIDKLTLQSQWDGTGYDAIYLPGAALQTLHPQQFATLKAHLQQRTTLLVELEELDTVACVPSIQRLESNLSISLEPVEPRQSLHECCTTPFLFDLLPTVGQQPIQLWAGEGVIVIAGHLSSAWGLHSPQPLPRHEIRTAQEFGINLLAFAQRRRQLSQLLLSTWP